MEAPQSVNAVEALPVPEDKSGEELPNNVKGNCEKTSEVPHVASNAPVMEAVDEGNAALAGEVVSNSIAAQDKQDVAEDENKKDMINNKKEAGLVHIEHAPKESIALDKPKRQRKKKEPKDYDAITSSPFCHAATSPSRGQNKSPSRGSRSPARSGSNPSHGRQSPARGGQSPARGGQSPARGGQSPARGGQSPARGGQSPARGGQSPARSSQSPARSTQSPARGGQSPSRSTTSSDQGTQNSTNNGLRPGKDAGDVTCNDKTVNGTEITSQTGQTPSENSENSTVQDQSPTGKSVSAAGDSPVTEHSPSKKCPDTDGSGENVKLGTSDSLRSSTESTTEKKGGNTDIIDKTNDSDVIPSETGTVDGKKAVKKKAPKKNTKGVDSDMKQNVPLKQCSKKAKKRKSDGESGSENTSGAASTISNKQVKSPVINNRHGDIKDIVIEQSEPKKKKCKKTVKLNETTNGVDGSSLEKENTETESVSKAKKKCAKKKKQSEKAISSIAKDALDSADKLDTITAVLNHVIAESTKCYLEDNVDNDKPVKSKKKPAARKKVPQQKGDKTVIENSEKTTDNSEHGDIISPEQVNGTQQACGIAADGAQTETEKKSKKKKVVKATEESSEKQEENCKNKKKKQSVKSKTTAKGNCSESDTNVNSVTPSVVVMEDKVDPQIQNASVPSNNTDQPADSITNKSSDPDQNTSSNDSACEKIVPDDKAHCTEEAEQHAADILEQKEDDDGVDDNDEHSKQEASEGSKNDDGAQSSSSGSENRVFQCPKCSYNSKKKVSLRRHMTVHGVYECAHCDFVSDQNSEYEDHMRNKHPSRCGRKLCKKCNVLFRVDEIEQHEKECTGEKKKWSCSECKKEFKFLCTMRAHVQKWHVSSGIKCDKCEFEANTNYTLKKHIMKVHKPAKEKKPISCAECNKTFSSDSCYRQHMKLHEGQEYECPKCGKVFKSTRSMQTHVKIHDETKSVPCEVEGCTKVFKNVKVMEIHRKRCHENEPKKFKCTYGTCEQRFYTKYHLKRHEIMHTGERNYKCTYPDCSKAFHHAENLKVHLRSHNNIKCPQCRRTFKEESSLQTHLKIHENAKSRSKKKRKPPPVENPDKPQNNTESKPDGTSPVSLPSDKPAVKTGTTDDSGKGDDVAVTTDSQTSTSVAAPGASEEPEPKKVDNTQHDIYDFHDSDDEKLAVSSIARQTSPNKSPRIKVGGELLGTLPLPSAPDAMLVKSVAVSDDEPAPDSNKKKKKLKKKKATPENKEEPKPAEAECKTKEKKKVIKKKKAQEAEEKKEEEKLVEKDGEKEEEKPKKAKKPKKKVEKKSKEKSAEEKMAVKPEKKEESESKAKKKKPRKKKIEKEPEPEKPKDEVVEPEKKKKRKKKPKKVEELEPTETAEEPIKEPEAETMANPETEHETLTEPLHDQCPDDITDMCTEESGEQTELQPEEEEMKPKEDGETHQSEPEIGPQPSPTPEYLDDQQHGFFSPRPEQVEFQYPMAPRPVSPEEDDDDIDMMEMEQSYSEDQQEQKETKVLESPLSEMSSDMKSLTLPSVSRDSPGANHEDNDQHSDLVAGLSPTIKDISGQEDEMLNDIAKQVEAESAIAEDEATDMPPSNYPSSIHTTPPSVQPPSVPPASVPPPPQEVPVITSHTSHIMEESSAIGDMVSRYEGEAATRDLYQAPLSNSSSNQQPSSHHYSSIVDQQLSHKYLQEPPLSVQSHGHMLPDDNQTPTSSSPPSIPPPKYYMDGSSYPPSVYHSHRVPSVPPSDLPPTSPPGPAETTPTYSDSLSHSSSHYRSDSQPCPSYPPHDSLPSVTTPSYSSPPQNSYLDPHSASMVNNKEDTAIPSVSSADRTSDSMYLTTRSSNLPASAAETLPTNSSAPPSVSFGSDSLPTRELFGQYFGQDSTGSMPLTHPPLSQEQRGLPYPHSQSQTSLPTLPGANSADYFRRASAPFIPGTGYPSVTETLVPPPPQHWMSAHDERSRQWGQPSPIIPPPIPSELDSTSPLSRNPYVSRPSDYSFNPTTTSHSSKQTDSSYPGSQSISTPAERPTYDMTSAYMTSRTFNPNYTGPMPPPPPSAATQKQLEEAYRRAAQISDYRTLSQAAPPSMADMYSRMAVPPALGFDKYYYPRDAMFRSQHLSAAPNPFMTQSSTPQMPYTERDYGRNPIYTQHSAYGFMGDKQYLASNKLPPTLPGLQERPMPTDYLQSPAAAAAMGDPHIQDPYRRSVIYNMMSRYF